LTVVIGMPLALWVMASGRRTVVPQAAVGDTALDEIPNAQAVRVPDLTVAEAMRVRSFWLIVAALFAVNVPGAGIVGQLAPLMGDKGFSATAAGTLTALYATGLLLGRLATGFALDRFPPALVGAVMTSVPALGMLILLGGGSSFALAALAILMIGLQQGSEVDLIAYFVSRRFGVAHYSTIYGRVATFGAVGTAVGLVLFGYVHDLTASYDVALVLGAGAFAAGAAAFAGLRR
jgi:cyanate permease